MLILILISQDSYSCELKASKKKIFYLIYWKLKHMFFCYKIHSLQNLWGTSVTKHKNLSVRNSQKRLKSVVWYLKKRVYIPG